MGQAGNALLGGADRDAVVDALDRLYCRHLVAMRWALAVRNRLEGQPLFLLTDELNEVLDDSLDAARRLADRIAELDGAVTGDPAALRQRNGQFFVLPDASDLGAILASGLENVRETIAAYGEALETAAGDDITRQLLLELARREVARESDLEGVGAR
jgi:ferritin-like protein